MEGIHFEIPLCGGMTPSAYASWRWLEGVLSGGVPGGTTPALAAKREASLLAISSYDRERARRYKKWWSRQRGAPQGELIEVPAEVWQRRRNTAPEQKGERERASS